MCTAITYKTRDFYFGRNLDFEFTYDVEVCVTPRNFPIKFSRAEAPRQLHAMIGMAYVSGGYPLYYDAVNEKGLAMAGLNFPGNAFYAPVRDGAVNVAPYEFIPYILGKCASVSEAESELARINLADIPFSAELPPTPLHWIIADASRAITVEPTADGLKIYENRIGVLTNNPPFPDMELSLADYLRLTPYEPENTFAPEVPIAAYSRGLGGAGLPGDMSSRSRFIKAAFVKSNSLSDGSEVDSVNQFFHILCSVEQPRGCVRLKGGNETTIYSSCCNADRGIYYYTTYGDRTVRGVDMHRCALESDALSRFKLVVCDEFDIVNR